MNFVDVDVIVMVSECQTPQTDLQSQKETTILAISFKVDRDETASFGEKAYVVKLPAIKV